ncbi:MAG: threonine synthase [Candidatus Hecatellales archaeon]|nr:MAG: threonine synthase [Candidatus Hecatellales archaeon]
MGCHEKISPEHVSYYCGKCGDLLEVKYDYEKLKLRLEESGWKNKPLSVWKYEDFLPIIDKSKIVSLREGGTKLYKCSRLAEKLGLKNLYIKNEGENPTGSFKDRGMTVGVTKALEYGVKTVVCASTGNTSASLAAYAAKAGVRCLVVIPSGKVAYGKLAQAIVYGAEVVQIRGNFDDALNIIIRLSLSSREVYMLNSVNPYRLEGQKTLAYEVVEQLDGKPPDRVVVPVGNAGNISAIWKGFKEFKDLGFIDSLPKMMGVQAEGASPIAKAVKAGEDTIKPIPKPETVATAIRIGAPVNWKKAIRAIRESDGGAEIVSDEEILEAQKVLARSEGLFVEPASASSIAGLKKFLEVGEIDRDETVVCVTTGHGLKDPDTPVKFFVKPVEVEADLNVIRRIVGV